MSRNRGLTKEAVLPQNPKWVTIDATDGDSRRWPANTSPNPDAEGHVNFMLPLPFDHAHAIKWRLVIGKALAEMHKYPDLDSKSWVLKDWPAGYQFYDHHKGQDNGTVRHDLYLVGSEHVLRFRSPQEFIPHAFWLMTDSTRNRANCHCKYCTRKPQREISDAFGLSQRAGSSPSSTARVPVEGPRDMEKRRRTRLQREAQFATSSVRRTPKPMRLPKGPTQFVVPEREKDLRAALGPKTLCERRWAREGELVWVKLDHPIPLGSGHDSSDEVVTCWPGLIEDVHFKTDIAPRQYDDELMPDNSASKSDGQCSRDGADADADADVDVPWTLAHRWLYKIKLLVVSKSVVYGDDHILPYQSHAPDTRLLAAVQSLYFDPGNRSSEEMVPPSTSNESEDAEARLYRQFESFDPFPTAPPVLHTGEERTQFCESAAGAFAVAIQIASRLTMYWTPSDQWEYKMLIPSTTAHGSTDISSTSRTPLALQALSQRMLGTQQTDPGTPSTQMRFQGLWWGPERIWMGDLVRVKLARYQLAPNGAEKIKKPSGAGKSGRLENGDDFLKSLTISTEEGGSTLDADMRNAEEENLLSNGNIMAVKDADSEMKLADVVDTEQLGAVSRSIFMRIDGIFIVQVPREDGQGIHNVCRICGMLYELADDDWESEDEELTGDSFAPEASASGDVHTPSHRSKLAPGTVIATPLTNLALSVRGAAPLVQDYNNPSSQSAPPSPSSSSLFAANPALLSELPMDTDVLGSKPVSTNSDVFIDSAAPPPRPSSTLSSSASTKGKARAIDLPVAKQASVALPNPSLSGPLKSAESMYPLPLAPLRCRFRSILPDEHEAVLPLEQLAGRYYPALLSNPLVGPRVRAAMLRPHARDSDALWALEGFVAGAYNAVDASFFLPSRVGMVREAEKVAWKELVSYWRSRVAEKNAAIVVDDD